MRARPLERAHRIPAPSPQLLHAPAVVRVHGLHARPRLDRLALPRARPAGQARARALLAVAQAPDCRHAARAAVCAAPARLGCGLLQPCALGRPPAHPLHAGPPSARCGRRWARWRQRSWRALPAAATSATAMSRMRRMPAAGRRAKRKRAPARRSRWGRGQAEAAGCRCTAGTAPAAACWRPRTAARVILPCARPRSVSQLYCGCPVRVIGRLRARLMQTIRCRCRQQAGVQR